MEEKHSQSFIEEIQKQVSAEQEALTIRLAEHAAEEAGETDEKLIDEVDIAVTTQTRALAAQMRNRDLIYGEKLRGAMQRIANGTYGICRFCEELIPEARLRARPTADAHVDCKQEEENAEKRANGNQRPSTSGRMTYGDEE